MKDPCMEDQIAISRLKQGDLNGLEILVNRYQVQAVHAAYLILYDRQLAEDIVQSTFIKVAQRIHQFDDQRPFAPWFFRIILNDARKLAEKQVRDVSLNTASRSTRCTTRKMADGSRSGTGRSGGAKGDA